jgi:hypothetical protein
MNKRAQAMVFDALIFLSICGAAAAVMLWSGSVYGNKAIEVYQLTYINEFEYNTLEALSEFSYYDGSKGGAMRYFMDDVGDYMVENGMPGGLPEGVVAESEVDKHLDGLAKERIWNKWRNDICPKAPAPMELRIHAARWYGNVNVINEDIVLWCEGVPEETNDEARRYYYGTREIVKACGPDIICTMKITVYY